jgi:hypothetical protein
MTWQSACRAKLGNTSKLEMKSMMFGPMKVKQNGEPVKADELNVGETYFSVQFLDDAMLLPELEPVVFIGNDLGGDSEGESYFQDAQSYLAGGTHKQR